MFNRIYDEFHFQTLKLTDCISENATCTQPDVKFTDVMKFYEEKFVMISQGGHNKLLFFDLRLNELLNTFSVSICSRFDNRTTTTTTTRCSKDCECKTSIDIGTHIFEMGGVHTFHQMGNYIIGSIVEQQTDPLTRIAIKFDR